MGSLRPPEFDVILDGVGKQIHILKDHADLVHQRFQSVLPDVLSAHSDSTSVHVPEPGNQMAEGGFPAAGGAHDGRGGLIRNTDRDILKDRLFVIGKGHVVQGDLMGDGSDICPGAVHFRQSLNLVRMVDGAAYHPQDGCGAAGGLNLGEDHKGDNHRHDPIG